MATSTTHDVTLSIPAEHAERFHRELADHWRWFGDGAFADTDRLLEVGRQVEAIYRIFEEIGYPELKARDGYFVTMPEDFARQTFDEWIDWRRECWVHDGISPDDAELRAEVEWLAFLTGLIDDIRAMGVLRRVEEKG